MKTIKEKAKKWCGEHSNKGCTEQCDGCWQLKQAFGCEQHNMETAYEAGANYVIMEILDKTSKCITIKDAYEAFLECIEQLKK